MAIYRTTSPAAQLTSFDMLFILRVFYTNLVLRAGFITMNLHNLADDMMNQEFVMKRYLPLLGLALLAGGCFSNTKMMTVHVDGAPAADNKATVILYHQSNYREGFLNEYPITVDGVLQGTVIAEKPLKICVSEGTHTLFTNSFGLNSRGVTQHFKAGEVYFFSVQKKYSTFYDTLVIAESDRIKYYEIVSHR